MPKLNGTGPSGKGPKTGRALGKCENTHFRNCFRSWAKDWVKGENQAAEQVRGKD